MRFRKLVNRRYLRLFFFFNFYINFYEDIEDTISYLYNIYICNINVFREFSFLKCLKSTEKLCIELRLLNYLTCICIYVICIL